MPETLEKGTPPFISFKYEVGTAIADARRALIRGNATAELTALWGTLHPWGKDDKEFQAELGKLELAMLKIDRTPSWPRPTRPSWQARYYALLIGVAKRNELLDIEATIHLDEDEL